VCELCDDTFEEHVLAYPSERTGLHLHGLNANTAQFQTRSMKEVEAFAQQWGFLPTRFIQVDHFEEVNRFTAAVAETGKWQGVAIEGFVVRTRMPTHQDAEVIKRDNIVSPPYTAGQTWFYKVKFDEPYLMYRDWRELTRKMLSEKEAYDKSRETTDTSPVKQPEPVAVKKKRPETQLFVQWCHERLYGSKDGRVAASPELFEKLQDNIGIIRLREEFLAFLASPEGERKLSVSKAAIAKTPSGARKDVPFTKTLIVPVAIPGCGKTALAIALTHLFPFIRHTQSDNVQTKRTGPTFLKNVVGELDKHDVVFADRNNHIYKHRDEIVKSVKSWESSSLDPANGKKRQKSLKKEKVEEAKEGVEKEMLQQRHVRLIALVWSLDPLPLNAIHHLCSDRLVERGDNHQSLRVESGREHEQVLWQFLQKREAFGGEEQEDEGQSDAAFDDVIAIDLHSTMEDSVMVVATRLARLLKMPLPSVEQANAAVEKARQYRVSVKKEPKAVVQPSIRYYGLSLDLDLVTLAESIAARDDRAKAAVAELVRQKRVVSRPHVTLVHNSETGSAAEGDQAEKPSSHAKKEEKEETAAAQKRWEFYSSLYQKDTGAVLFHLEVDCLAWDDRAMSLGISKVSMGGSSEFQALQGEDWRPHITVGTFHEDIRPFEGKRVLCEADEGLDSVFCIHLKESLQMQGRLRGLN
jgi:tRNA ligase